MICPLFLSISDEAERCGLVKRNDSGATVLAVEFEWLFSIHLLS